MTSDVISEIRDIELTQIDVSNDNVRHKLAPKPLEELAESIKLHGLLQPVVLMGVFGSPPYELISGQRRFLAHQKLNCPTIKAVFVPPMNKTEKIIRSLVENMQRQELDYTDTAEAVTYLYKQLGDEYKVKAHTGLAIQTIRDFLYIDALASDKMKELLKEQKVTKADVKRALRAAQDDISKAEILLELMASTPLSAHQKRRIVNYSLASPGEAPETILEKAMKPHVESKLVLAVPEWLRDALNEASQSLEVTPEELIERVISDWLEEQGFEKGQQ